MYFVYIICNQHSVFYIGYTGNLQSRLKSHNENRNFYTRNKGLWKIIYIKEFSSRGEAMRWEKYLKKQKGGNGLKKLLGKNPKL
jgi:putative endonuclease